MRRLTLSALFLFASLAHAQSWTPIATEGGSFTVMPSQVVRYGAGSYWITKSGITTGSCTNAFFQNDPLFGTVKGCQVATLPTLPMLPTLTKTDAPGPFGASPVCSGPLVRWNTPDFYVGVQPDGSRVIFAFCQMPDGGFAGWLRQRPPGEDINAPIVWLTDTAQPGVMPTMVP